MFVAASTATRRGSQVWVPWFVLVVGLAVTVFAAWYISHSSAMREQARFHGLADAVVDQLQSATDDYSAALRGASGLFAAVGSVDADQFDAYATGMDLVRRYPALRGFGYAPRVPAERKAEFISIGRQQISPAFHIWPPSDHEEMYPNFYAEPRDGRKRPGIGFDILSDPGRRNAFERARDTALPSVTARLHLLSQTHDDPVGAFLIFYPIYSTGKAPLSLEDRRARITGTVFAAFLANEFFERIFDSQVRDRMQIFVYDNAAPGGQLLFDPTLDRPEHSDFTPHLRETRDVEFAGRTWTLRMMERRDFDQETGDPMARFILLGGCGISLVLFAVTRGQSVAQASAEASAVALTLSAEALRSSQARLRRLVDSNLIGVFFCGIDGKILDGNDEFFRLIGRSPKAGLPLSDTYVDRVVGPEHLDAQREAMNMLQTTGVCPPRETSFIRPDGSIVPALIGSAIVDGSRTEAVAFTIDLTDRKKTERELQSAKEAAEAANKSKDQFLAVLSHELRTPLTPVLAVTTAARDDLSLSAEARAEMAMIHRNVELEAKLIDDLLDLTRIGRGKLQLHLETIDLHQVIKAALEVSAAEVAEKGLSVEEIFSATQHHVRGDPARMQQVFWNLIKNAVKFTPAGGKIRIRTFNAGPAADGWQTFSAEVIDDGLGIEADLLPKIFDAFEQGSLARAQASGGLGLGLAISRGLVEAHGGNISAHSAGSGHGATFTVALPTVPATSETRSGKYGTPTVLPASSLRILLVEDHVDTARVLARLLKMAGHQVEIGNCVADALRLASDIQFDLLVSDLGLPDGSGIDVIQGFRQKQTSALSHAIALTGFGAEMDVARTMAAGFDEHLTKPISFQNLQQTIERVISARQGRETAVSPSA